MITILALALVEFAVHDESYHSVAR